MAAIRSISALFLAFSFSVASASEFSSLEEKMTGSEFSAAGLERLSADELARLNAWLRDNWPAAAHARSLATPGATEDRRGFVDRMVGSGDSIVSSLAGTFSGWTSSSRFELDNGMVWEVAEGSSFSVRSIENPRVTISRGMLDTWYLRVDGYNRQVKVRRIR